MAACEGAFRLQSAHPSLVSQMSFDITASRRWRGLAVPLMRSLYGLHGDSVRLCGIGMGGRRHSPGRGVRPLLHRETRRWAKGLSG